ncbi:Cof-type HAD-IIB family hydrolase [Fusibacter tunisiensis]|uniref:Cof subfamily protein (Haloacid dehalogenase superfamily) n=1 Tax=Fusibacter tunisiensis TaxID=1008308 RepID=A0ABS2MNX2_9FIRM|nr:Cof-type HAD-IIB family hydrolase [Fusibacter tunisiensis]MBM7561101.1 Cof subfamily protein (haloacid dehalogenase superfamily) [Fusibacter tunisiensis]
MRKLIVSDIDGTLLRNDKSISDHTKNTIFKAIEDGHIFAIATGRMHGAGKIITQTLDYNGYLISCNGAVVKHLKTGELLQAIELPKETAHAVVKICKKYDVYFHFYDIETIYAERREHLAKGYADGMAELPEAFKFNVVFESDLSGFVDKVPIYKIGLYSEHPEIFQKVMQEINLISGVQTCKSLTTSFDVMAEGVSKATGIEAIRNHYNIPVENVIALGDNENDMDMVKYAGVGVAMGNATEALKAVADFVTKDNESDGLVYALERFVNESQL